MLFNKYTKIFDLVFFNFSILLIMSYLTFPLKKRIMIQNTAKLNSKLCNLRKTIFLNHDYPPIKLN